MTTRPAHPLLPLVLLVLAALLAGCAALPASDPAAVPGVRVIPRAAWGANPPVLPMQPHAPRQITIHHTAVRQQPQRPLAEKLSALQRFSQHEGVLASGGTKPAWADVPYHYYIDHRGRVAQGREVAYTGDSNTAYDPTGHVLIVLEGNFEEEQPTPQQLRSLRRMVAGLAYRWQIPAGQVQGHKDHAETLCPGAHLYAHLPALRELVASRR